MNMKVAVQPVALWTHFIFHTLQIYVTKASFPNTHQVEFKAAACGTNWHYGEVFLVRHERDRGIKQFTTLLIILLGLLMFHLALEYDLR